MVSIAPGLFRTVLLTPEGKLLDCRAASVLVPAHDGMIGILRNHAPMLCELGKGIVYVKDIRDRKDAFFIIDAGFARISLNYLTILAYDVITFENLTEEQAEDLVHRAKETVAAKGFFTNIKDEKIDMEKANMIVKMASLSGFGND